MVTLLDQGGRVNYNSETYIVDNVSDLDELNVVDHTVALCVNGTSGATVYIKSEGTWKEI